MFATGDLAKILGETSAYTALLLNRLVGPSETGPGFPRCFGYWEALGVLVCFGPGSEIRKPRSIETERRIFSVVASGVAHGEMILVDTAECRVLSKQALASTGIEALSSSTLLINPKPEMDMLDTYMGLRRDYEAIVEPR